MTENNVRVMNFFAIHITFSTLPVNLVAFYFDWQARAPYERLRTNRSKDTLSRNQSGSEIEELLENNKLALIKRIYVTVHF